MLPGIIISIYSNLKSTKQLGNNQRGIFFPCVQELFEDTVLQNYRLSKGHPEHSHIFFVTVSLSLHREHFYSSHEHSVDLFIHLKYIQRFCLQLSFLIFTWQQPDSNHNKERRSTHPHITEQSLEIWDFISSSQFPLWGHLLVLLWITSRVSVTLPWFNSLFATLYPVWYTLFFFETAFLQLWDGGHS